MRELVGIVGGYGAVGSALAERLIAWRGCSLRLAGRHPDQARALARQLSGSAEACFADLGDPASLRALARGCRVVVNCAGPTSQSLDHVAHAAFAEGADYVDAYGDDAVHGLLRPLSLFQEGRRAVLSAGVMPGVAGLLPRWLGQMGFARSRRLVAHVGGLERVTPAAAADYILSLGNGYGEALAAWRCGRRVGRALQPKFEAEVPFFPRPVTVYPFLSTEAERVGHCLKLEDLEWNNVFDGTHGLAALTRLQERIASKPLSAGDLEGAAAELSLAAELDLFGRQRYQVLLFQLEGAGLHGNELCKTLVLRAACGFRLSGTMNALAVISLLEGVIEPGLHYAADALAPAQTVDRLRSAPAVQSFEVSDGPAHCAHEEGEL